MPEVQDDTVEATALSNLGPQVRYGLPQRELVCGYACSTGYAVAF